MRQESPDFLCDKRHKRVKELEHILQAHNQSESGNLLILFVIAPESWLYQLDIPVAVLVPDKIINLLTGQCQIVSFHSCVHVFDGFVYFIYNPLILILQWDVCKVSCISTASAAAFLAALGHFLEAAVLILEIHDYKSRSIPKLVGKVSAGFQSVFLESHVVARCDTCGKHESQCVCAVLVYDFKRVYAVAQ